MITFKIFNYQYFLIYLLCIFFNVYAEKYTFCVVDSKENDKHISRNCPNLDEPNLESPVKCVIALDRLDCLRKIHKGFADFGVFTPEDLVAAINSEFDLFITNELRYSSEDNFEYEVVSIVSNNANIRNIYDVRGKRFCHPGYGYEADWTRILSNYFEASVVTQQCDPNLTITENRIKASADYFSAACKSGPWVNNPLLDRKLKSKYRNLCSLCGDPGKCAMQDKYWGRRGSLYCLSDGAGEISWARWEDAKQHFGLIPGGQKDDANKYSLLCPDGTVAALNSTKPACIWVVKPWSVIAARKGVVNQIQELINSLQHAPLSPWKLNLLQLIDPTYFNPIPVTPILSTSFYFDRAKGFLNANSFSGCHPPRTIRICTVSNIETAKCSWLRESAAVYGIEPDLDCLKADNKTHCMMALNDNAADILMISPDLVHQAKKNFNLSTLFYETVSDKDKYMTVPVIRNISTWQKFEDLKGIKACFPIYDGIAWNSVMDKLQQDNLIERKTDSELLTFFGPSCVADFSNNANETLVKSCQEHLLFNKGDLGALQCLENGIGDVAFVSKNSLTNFASDRCFSFPAISSSTNRSNFKIMGSNNNKESCYLSWAPVGQAMIRSSSSDLWKRDTLDVFQSLDLLFGKSAKKTSYTFSLFGRYDGVSNVLFHDVTEKFRDVPTLKNSDNMEVFYEDILSRENSRSSSLASAISFNSKIVFFYLILVLKYYYF